jgi:hypothetical protein
MILCKLCIALTGVRTSDALPNEEALIAHIEAVHHMPVKREGETEVDAQRRFLAKHPDAATCQDCIDRAAPWTIRSGARSAE